MTTIFDGDQHLFRALHAGADSYLIEGHTPDELVSEALAITNNTDSYHIKNIYSKLNINNRTEATAAAIKLNLFNPNT